MATGERSIFLERLGILFLVIVVFAAFWTISLIGRGFLEARAATKGARAFISSFEGDICRTDWSSAYSKMEASYQADWDVVQFQKSVVMNAPANVRISECPGTMDRVWRDADGQGWRARFDEYLTYDGGSNKIRCVAHKTQSGWVMEHCDALASSQN